MTKKEVIIFVSIAFLAIFSVVNYVLLSKISESVQSLRNLEHRIQDISSSMQGIQSSVDQTMDDFLEEQLWVRNSQYEIDNLHMEGNLVDVSVSWALRDIKQEERLNLQYREKGTEAWQNVEVQQNESMNYKTKLSLSLLKNYETQIVAFSEDDNRSESLVEIAIHEQLEGRIHADIQLAQFGNNTHYTLAIMIQHYMGEHPIISDKNLLEFESAEAYILVDNQLVQTIDVLEESHTTGHKPYDIIYDFHDDLTFEDEFEDVRVELVITDRLGFEYKRESEKY